jgi:hypothetical protein
MDSSTMDEPLLVATVLARGATLGLGRANHTFFWDYFAGLRWGLVDHDIKPTPLFHAYELLAALIGSGADRLVIASASDGALGGSQGAVIAARDGVATRVLLVNRDLAAHTTRVDVNGQSSTPKRVRLFDDPASAVREIPPSMVIAVPARAIALVEM